MSTSGTSLPRLAPRLIAEFMVIVIGVLVALAVDGWATARSERVMEVEYLERLLEDVRFDLNELTFVETSAVDSWEAAEVLQSPAAIRGMAPDLLTASLFVAANQREPDLSRSTFGELISSGRIDLLQSTEVRRALADYDRIITEISGVWLILSTDLRRWSFSRVPTSVYLRFQEACVQAGSAITARMGRVCNFDLGGWSAEQLRADLMTVEAQQELMFATHRYRTATDMVGVLRAAAEQLERVLEAELAG